MRALSREEMVALDRETIDKGWATGAELMQAAGNAVAREVQALSNGKKGRVVIICGKGNNGGDGLIAAVTLKDLGFSPEVILTSAILELKGDAAIALTRWQDAGGTTLVLNDQPDPLEFLSGRLQGAALMVDAIFGTGLVARKDQDSKEPSLEFQVIKLLRFFSQKGIPVLAVDLPSGMDANTGLGVLGEEFMVKAKLTVTMGLPKLGCVGDPGILYCGTLKVAGLPYPKHLLQINEPPHVLIDPGDFAPHLQSRNPSSHKGDFGTVYVIAGSRRMPGALLLACRAAVRGGAGKVVGIVPGQEISNSLCDRIPETMWFPVSHSAGEFSTEGAGQIYEYLSAELKQDSGRKVVVMGPGIGTGSGIPDVLENLSKLWAAHNFALVLDADALNVWAQIRDQKILFQRGGGVGENETVPLILTPHPGELGRLLKKSSKEIQAERIRFAKQAVQEFHGWIVLKGFRSVLAGPPSGSAREGTERGGTLDINASGNPGMARGGMGDVLSGLLGARLARLPAYDRLTFRQTLQAGVYLHGWAGDLAAQEKGEEGILPSDLIEKIPEALRFAHD